MTILDSFRIALSALARNKLRSLLTILGIVIGVASLIAMVALGEGAKATVDAAFARMGSNLLIVMPGASQKMGAWSSTESDARMTWDDLKAIKNEIRGVRGVAPNLNKQMQVISSTANWSTSVRGTTADFFDLRNWSQLYGRWFDASEESNGARVVVLGATVANELFGAGLDPTGQNIRIGPVPFEVVGVAAPKGSSPMGYDYDDVVFIPAKTYQTKLERKQVLALDGMIYVGGDTKEDLPRIEREIMDLLRERHHTAAGSEDTFSVRNLTELASEREQGVKAITMLLACVALVSLIVGGIGVMNIMLVSVTERTREIGIRLAVGARPGDILQQFIIESAALSAVGGAFGVGLGLASATQLTGKFGWPLVIRPEITVIALISSAFVGIVFGLYPAFKASRLTPIQALRTE